MDLHLEHIKSARDGNKGQRSVVHRLSFVGDLNDPHYGRNAFEAGEDSRGKNAHSLKKGCTQPQWIATMSTVARAA